MLFLLTLLSCLWVPSASGPAASLLWTAEGRDCHHSCTYWHVLAGLVWTYPDLLAPPHLRTVEILFGFCLLVLFCFVWGLFC